MNSDTILSLLCKLNDTIDAQAAEIARLQAEAAKADEDKAADE